MATSKKTPPRTAKKVANKVVKKVAKKPSKKAAKTVPKKAAKKTSKKKATKKLAKKVAKKTTQKASRRRKSPLATIRMYRVGIGDCFLVTLPRGRGKPFRMLIDCGVHQSQSGGSERIRLIAQDITQVTEGFVDVLVATHEHWDHISGFGQAQDIFKEGLSAGAIWLGWTEDNEDPQAQSLAKAKKKGLVTLEKAITQSRRLGLNGAAARLEGFLGFYGDGAGKKLAAAGAALKSLCSDPPEYRSPEQDPVEFKGADARVYFLGPPRDPQLLKRAGPNHKDSEVYGVGRQLAAAEALDRSLSDAGAPFDEPYCLPLDASEAEPFFARHYWRAQVAGELAAKEESTQTFRRIDDAWMEPGHMVALHLDSATNNTSLVMAIELGPPDEDGPVLLFAADAQVGSWLSWQDLKWQYQGRTITGPDLLHRTVVYKVGHHASHNATLEKLGLEQMKNIDVALIPTKREMAQKVGWGGIPWPALLDRLDQKTQGRVVRTDVDTPSKKWTHYDLKADPEGLFYELEVRGK